MLRLSATALRRTSTVFRCFSTTTGSVKWYNRKKAYGFVLADPESGVEGDIFIHRNNISGASNDQPMGLPFLVKDERVQFELSTTDDKQLALNLKKEDGSLIPVFRELYTENFKKGTKSAMGRAIYDILDNDVMSEEDKVSRIMQEFEQAKNRVEELEAQKVAAEQAAESEKEEAV